MSAAILVFGLPLLDIIVIIAYFAVVLWIGFRAMKRIKNPEDYFLAGRRFGKSIQTFAAFGQGTSAESAVTTTTMVSTNGAAGLGMGLINGIVGMPMFWMITMWYRRMRYLSLAEFFAERYHSKPMAGFYAVTQTLMFMIAVAGGFTAMSKTVAAIAEKPETELTQQESAERALAFELRDLKDKDYRLLSAAEQLRLANLAEQNPQLSFSYINRNWLTITLAVIVLLYAVSGGLDAAFITDMIQGIFIIILTLMLIPFAMVKINGLYGKSGFMGTFEAFHDQLPEAFFRVLGSPNLPQFTWYFIAAFGTMAIINTAVQANQLTAAGSAKDDETARFGFIAGIFIKRYCGVIWGFIAMMTLLLYGTQVSDPDYVWGLATRELLPVGLVGLMIACLMAALMSTADALMLTSSSLLTNSVYRPMFPGKSDAHYIFAGRLFCLACIIGGESFIKHDYIRSQSIFWQKGLEKNADGQLEGGGLLKVELVLLDWLGWDLTKNKHALNEAMTAILRLIVPFGSLILVSLFTARVDKRRLDFFYARLRTPVVADHDEDAREVALTRENPARCDDTKLFPGSNWEFRKWTARDWKGQAVVVVAAAGVAVLLWAVVGLGG